jgi:cell division protein ZapA
MAEVNLKINGRSYPILCDDGQEQRVLGLADYINQRLNDIKSAGAADSENHLLVLTSLIMADEVHELRDNLATAEQLLNENGVEAPAISSQDETSIAEAINSLANRIALVADQIQQKA